jgi:hypothetical protein
MNDAIAAQVYRVSVGAGGLRTKPRNTVPRALVCGFRWPVGAVPRLAAVRGAVAACGRPAGRVRADVPSRQDPDRRPLFSCSLSDGGLASLVAFSV